MRWRLIPEPRNLLAIPAFVVVMVMIAGCELSGENELTLVPTHYVCMVNDMFFGKDQIPVEVGGRTYYGCCAGCEKTIRENARVRVATDPVSGRIVDKATAKIGALPDGAVYYFENEKNMKMYRTDASS